MPIQSSACFFDCPDACGMRVETDETGAFVALRGNREHGWSEGTLCTKTSLYGEVIRSEDRILKPWIRGSHGRFHEATWEQALDRIVHKVAPLKSEQVLSLDYAGNMGVLGRRFPKRIMNALGYTLNDGGICDATASAGFSTVLGDAIGFDLEKLETCDVIVLWGCDVARTMSHILPRLKRAIAGGAQVWVLDILESDTVQWVRKQGGRALILHPGSDAALALALCQVAFDDRRADLEFLKSECVGAAEFRSHIAGRYGLDAVEAICGLQKRDVLEFAHCFHGAKAPLLKMGIGLARRQVGGMTMRAIGSYAAVLGIADRVHWESGDHFDLDLSELEGRSLRPPGSDHPEVKLVQLGKELETGRFEASFVWSHNPAVTVPDSNAVRAGLSNPNHFMVVHELFWTATAKLADVVLPATTFLDQPDLLRSYGHRHIHYVPKVLEPRGECKSNLDAFASIGKALGLGPEVWEGSAIDWCSRILHTNRLRFSDAEWETLWKHEPVKLALRKRTGWGTPSGKIELLSKSAESAGLPAMAEYTPDRGTGGGGEFWLWPGPSKATHNSTFLYSKRHLARMGAPEVRMNPKDAMRLSIEEGEQVEIFNRVGQLTVSLRCSSDVPTGALSLTGFFDEALVPEGTNVNALIASDLSDQGDGSSLYSARVSIRRKRASQSV